MGENENTYTTATTYTTAAQIYGLFREGIYYCAALKQGTAEDGGDFDERGDERWIATASSVQMACGRSDDDWFEISEEDLQKYLLGSHGGDNDSGYIRDTETGLAVSAPPIEKTYEQEVAEVQAQYKVQSDEIKDAYLTAVLTNDDSTIAECKADFQNMTVENETKITELIDKYFGDKE